MPSYEYNHKHKAFVKECSCCKHLTIGTNNQEESIRIFQQVFSQSNGAGMADGMQSRCYTCNSSKRRQLGITHTILEGMWQSQNGRCAICNNEISIIRNASSDIHAHVDHNNDTGKIRELLCGNCNRGIGLFRHNPEILKRATSYIEKHTVEVIVPFKRAI